MKNLNIIFLLSLIGLAFANPYNSWLVDSSNPAYYGGSGSGIGELFQTAAYLLGGYIVFKSIFSTS